MRSAVSRGREDVTQLTMRELDYAGVAGVAPRGAVTRPLLRRCPGANNPVCTSLLLLLTHMQTRSLRKRLSAMQTYTSHAVQLCDTP